MTKLDTREGSKVMEGLSFIWEHEKQQLLRQGQMGWTTSAFHPATGSVKFSIWRGWESLQPCPSRKGCRLLEAETHDELSCRNQVSYILACVLCWFPKHTE